MRPTFVEHCMDAVSYAREDGQNVVRFGLKTAENLGDLVHAVEIALAQCPEWLPAVVALHEAYQKLEGDL